MPTARQKQDLLKAHHEAGHAVVARVLGIAVSHMSLLPTDDEDRGAHAPTESATYKARSADRTAQLDAIERDMKVCFAGPYAQRRYQPQSRTSIDGEMPTEWESDIENAKGFAGRYVLTEHGMAVFPDTFTLDADDAAKATSIFRRVAAETETLVADNWLAILRVAKALATHRELSCDDIDDLIAGRRLSW